MDYELTKHFLYSSMKSKDGSSTPFSFKSNLQHLAEALEVVRLFYALPMFVNSAYRSPAHNVAVGGSPKSFHLLGKASDVYIDTIEPIELYQVFLFCMRTGLIPFGGLGLYDNFVHYDTRGYLVQWDERTAPLWPLPMF